MNYLFDIGNVLLLLDFPSFRQRVFGSNHPTEEYTQTIATIKDPYEIGEMSNEEFISCILRAAPDHISSDDFVSAWNDIFSANQPMWDLALKLKEEGHTLILFSNTNALHAEYFLREFSIFKHFEHHHFSQEVGVSKPDAGFYQKAIETYQLTPSETIYFDDLPENICTGEELGFLCHQYDFNNHAAALEWHETTKTRTTR